MHYLTEDFATWCVDWNVSEYDCLSVLLTSLLAVARVHQTNHWSSKGEPFYGDHLLFERLYSETNDEVDSVAEKIVGLSNIKGVDVVKQSQQIDTIISSLLSTLPYDVPACDNLINVSLDFEKFLLKVIDLVIVSLKASRKLSLGIENMLGSLADKHESHVFLLSQRSLRGNST